MFKLKMRGITVLTDEQAALVAGGATVKVTPAKAAVSPVKANAADDSATGDFCTSLGCTSDNCDSLICTSNNCDSEICDSFGCASNDGCYSAECSSDTQDCPSADGRCT